jgi:hypothetical protein
MRVRLLSLLISTLLSVTLGCGTSPTEPLPEDGRDDIQPSPARPPLTPRLTPRPLPTPAAAIVFGTVPAETVLEPIGGEASRSIRADVEWAKGLALRKLEKSNCRLIFSDFEDSAGRTLQRNLDDRGETGSQLLRRLAFRDGTGERPCGFQGVLAFTTPGGLVISICAPVFRSTLRGHPALAANILLHEELHRLGLGESSRLEQASSASVSGRSHPPTSLEITDRVAARCGS